MRIYRSLSCKFLGLVTSQDIPAGGGIKKSYRVGGICQIIPFYKVSLVEVIRRVPSFYLSLCSYPRINHFIVRQILSRYHAENKICQSKGKNISNTKFYKHISNCGQTTNNKSPMPKPHEYLRMMVKLFPGHTCIIEPLLRCDIRLFDASVRKKPNIPKAPHCKVSQNASKQTKPISCRDTHQKAQKYALISVKERPSDFLSLANSRLYFLGHHQDPFASHSTRKPNEFLVLFDSVKELIFLFSIPYQQRK